MNTSEDRVGTGRNIGNGESEGRESKNGVKKDSTPKGQREETVNDGMTRINPDFTEANKGNEEKTESWEHNAAEPQPAKSVK
jgi:hypothetical protein